MRKRFVSLVLIMVVVAVMLPSFAVYSAESDVVLYQGHRYKLFDYDMTWTEAKDYCESIGGHLLTITSADEQQFVEDNLLYRAKKNLYWIGLQENNNDIWEWVSGEDYSYRHWGKDEPNNDFSGTENVTQIYAKSYDEFIRGDWNDSQEKYTGTVSFYKINNVGFICEWDTDVSSDQIKVVLNGFEISFDQPPIMINDRVMVPMRAIFEALGYNVTWYEETKTAIAQKSSNTITVQLDKTKILYSRGEYYCDVAPRIVSDRILVPVRAISECDGCNVRWDDNNKIVIIESNNLTDDIIYTTKIININASSFEDWAEKIKFEERSLAGIPNIISNTNGTYQYNGNIIIDRVILEYSKINMKIPYKQGVGLPSEYKSITINVPSKIQYTLHRHKMENNMNSTFWGSFLSGLVDQKIVWTQSCKCGYQNQLEWVIPVDDFNQYTGDDLYIKTETKLY